MADELMDVCDENNNIIGQGMKGEILRAGRWHRVARVFVYNSKGEILMQLRGKDKDLYPDRWDVGAAGHVGAGENYLDAALREAGEELGAVFQKTDLELLLVDKCQSLWNDFDEKVFAYTYLVKSDAGIDTFKIQEEEVQELKFVAADNLEKDLKLNPEKYSPHPEEYWKRLLDGVREKGNFGE